eukprot:2825404-Rhodomonas_salina.1
MTLQAVLEEEQKSNATQQEESVQETDYFFSETTPASNSGARSRSYGTHLVANAASVPGTEGALPAHKLPVRVNEPARDRHKHQAQARLRGGIGLSEVDHVPGKEVACLPVHDVGHSRTLPVVPDKPRAALLLVPGGMHEKRLVRLPLLLHGQLVVT